MSDVTVTGLNKTDANEVAAKLAALGFSAEIIAVGNGLFEVRRTGGAATPNPQGSGGSSGASPIHGGAGTGSSSGGPSAGSVSPTSLSPPTGTLALNEEILRRLFARSAFFFPENEMVFFGIRSALPVDLNDEEFGSAKLLRPATIDYRSMACTLGQWMPGRGVAVFPGSTVPNETLIQAAANRFGEGANYMARCKVAYVKGVHKAGSLTGHRAFRQDGYFPGSRSRDAVIGDEDDFFDTSGTIFWDNLHAAWSSGPGKRYSSAGCQVVAGIPQSARTGHKPDNGPWARFRKNAYDLKQSRFVYALFNVADLQRAASPDSLSDPSLRFGSEGELVLQLQSRLREEGLDPGPLNGQFGRRTLQAVIAHQRSAFGPGGVDGVVGRQTLTSLNIALKPSGTEGSDTTSSDDAFESDEGEMRGDGTLGDVAPSVGPIVLRLRREDRRWLGEVAGNTFPIGTATQFTSGGRTRIGLFQSSADIATLTGGHYDPVAYRQRHGGLADLIVPTATAESALLFNRLNTYDRAAFTFGFMQLAAHTPQDNLVLLLRALLAQEDAKEFFPSLRLQDGLVRDESGRNMEEPDEATGELHRLMHLFKPSADRVTEEEASVGGRLMFWTTSRASARDAQVEVAVRIFRQRWTYFARKYDVDLRALPEHQRASVFVWAMDIRHQGRGKYAAMASAIKSSDPVGNLSAIGTVQAGPHRISTVRNALMALPQIDWDWLP